MCGICGVWNRESQPVSPGWLVRMRDSMAHRGPDGAGCVLFAEDEAVPAVQFITPEQGLEQLAAARSPYTLGLGHRRLSIIDLNTGDQPMCTPDRKLWIVYNGEVYNYRELRSELQALGHTFCTASDTEVILHAYAEYGTSCPEKFNGIFAFAIWDVRKQALFLARDHFGVKPLYFFQTKSRFAFGSELKAILADATTPREINLDALNMCLVFRHTPSPWTLFKGIYKMPPGTSMLITNDSRGFCVRERLFFNRPEPIDRQRSQEEWMDLLESTLEAGVSRQMVSDVPIALSLSSGVDSSTVLALMSQQTGAPVQAYTVGFAGRERSSEIAPARRVAERFGAEFHSQVITADDYAGFMERYLWHLEEPIGNLSAAAYYFVSRMAQQDGVKVLLNGQGSDEAFAGYERHLYMAHARLFGLAALPPARWGLSLLLRGTANGERYQRFLYTRRAANDTQRLFRAYSIQPAMGISQLLNPEAAHKTNPDLPEWYVAEQLGLAPQGTPLEKMMYIDTRTSLPDDLLLCEDKMSMAASVEARVPLLDLEFMRLAEQIPGSFKLRGRRDKYIFRQVCARWIGPRIAARPKIGFDNAVDLWLRAQLGSRMQEIVEAPESFSSVYLNQGLVLQLMQEHFERRRDHELILFLIFSLENWYNVFMQTGDSLRAT